MIEDDRAGELLAASVRGLWARRTLWFTSSAATLVAILAFIFLTPPTYTSDAEFIVESGQASAIEAIESLVPAEIRDRDLARNHAAVLGSRSLAGKVIAELGLAADPEFNSHLEVRRDGNGEVGSESLLDEARVLRAFERKLVVSTQSQSRVVKVKFSASTPEKAHAVVASLVEHYLRDQVEAKSAVAGRTQAWLEERLAALQEKLDEIDASIAEFQKSVGFIGEYDATLVTFNQLQLDNELALVASQKAQVQSEIDALNGAADSPGATSGTSKLRELRDRIASLRASELALKAGRKSLQQRLATINENQWHLKTLLDEKLAVSGVFAAYQARLRQIEGQHEIVQPSADLISSASFPVSPTFPRARFMGVLAVVIALFVGVLVVYLVETFGPAFRHAASD